MKRLFVFFLFLALCAVRQPAAQDSPPSNTAIIAGVVVKEPGSQPIKKVLLHLIAEDQKDGSNYTTETDSDGQFRFERVQPGRYRILLEKTGFHPVNPRGHATESAAVTVHAGQELTDLLFQMLPAAVITGRVVDGDGDPLAGFGVSLMRKRPGKERAPEVAGEERTNDLGEYRFSGLFGGQYFVAVVPPSDARNFVRTKDAPNTASKSDLSFLTTYYPGTSDFTQASAIDLRAGEEMPVNFTLLPSRSFRIRGLVTGIPANQKPMVQLLSKGVGQTVNGADVSPDGQFEIRGVAPGLYSIMVFGGSEGQILTAREPVQVVAADVEGIKLTPVRPFNISGTLRFDARVPGDLTHCSVYLRSLDDDSTSGISGTLTAQVDRWGNFQWNGLLPGTYAVQFNGDNNPDLFVKYVRMGATNNDGSFSITGPASLEVVVSPKGGMLEGAALDDDKPASNTTVVAVPEEKYRKVKERFLSTTTDQNGHFTIRGLAPGSYTVFAWQDLDDGLYYDAAFLKSQESNGLSVKLEEGSQQKIELKLSAVGEDWR
jgi:protocatechuate 3,4-dioxygenase beta subunit